MGDRLIGCWAIEVISFTDRHSTDLLHPHSKSIGEGALPPDRALRARIILRLSFGEALDARTVGGRSCATTATEELGSTLVLVIESLDTQESFKTALFFDHIKFDLSHHFLFHFFLVHL